MEEEEEEGGGGGSESMPGLFTDLNNIFHRAIGVEQETVVST